MKKHYDGNKLVPIRYENGAKGFIDPKTIPNEDWTVHHGKTINGVKVNSLKSTIIGKSILLQNAAGKTFSFDANEFEVAAGQLLSGTMGYDITVASKSGIRAAS